MEKAILGLILVSNLCDLNDFYSILVGHFVTVIKGSCLFRCDTQCSSTWSGGKEGRGVCTRTGSLDKLYTEE